MGDSFKVRRVVVWPEEYNDLKCTTEYHSLPNRLAYLAEDSNHPSSLVLMWLPFPNNDFLCYARKLAASVASTDSIKSRLCFDLPYKLKYSLS